MVKIGSLLVEILVGVLVLVLVVVLVVTGGKQSQLLAFALGLGWSLTIGTFEKRPPKKLKRAHGPPKG